MAIDISSRTRAVGVETKFFDSSKGSVKYLPQKIAVIGQGNTSSTYAATAQEITSAGQAAVLYGYGSPIHLAVRELFPASGNGVGSIPVTAYPLADASGAVAAAGAIGATGTQTSAKDYKIKIGGIETAKVSIASGKTAAEALAIFKTAIDSVLHMPVTTGTIAADSLPLTAKWKGESGNDISIIVEGETAGITFAVTAMASGATNPDVDSALALIGTKLETLVINCFNYDDDDTLDKLSVVNESKWSEDEHQPFIAFCATSDDYATRSVITDARKLDRTNCLIPVVGSNNFPASIAAAAVAKIAKVANNNPPRNYVDYLTTINSGTYAQQENKTTRELSVSKGSSNTILESGYVKLNDTITMYNPASEGLDPAYRYVVDIIKLQNIIYNVYAILNSDDIKGAPLVPDSTVTTNPTAVKPKIVKTVLSNLAVDLAEEAILAEAEYTQENLVVNISDQNPKRLDVIFPCKLSGNAEIVSAVINFGFYYGGA